jgi:plasmid stabilization system protein ParE
VKILLAPEAEADLQATLEFIGERNRSAAVKLGTRVFSTLEKLAESRVDGPEHRLTTGERVRSWLIPPFRIYYQRHQDVLHILRVYHHARRPVTR